MERDVPRYNEFKFQEMVKEAIGEFVIKERNG